MASASDFSALIALERSAPSAAHWDEENYNAVLAGVGPRRICMVCEHKGNIAAFTVVRIVASEWEIENVVVAAAVRRQGIASGMIDEIVGRASREQAERMLLEVRESNTAARALYAGAGFEECGRRVGYYREPAEDAIVYQRKLLKPTI